MDGFEAKVKELARIGRDVDRAWARVRRATQQASQAKRDAEAAERRFREAAKALTGGEDA